MYHVLWAEARRFQEYAKTLIKAETKVNGEMHGEKGNVLMIRLRHYRELHG